MANQAEIDYEKQFQEDLAKATALSIESQALDEFRRSKSQYAYMSSQASPPNAGFHKKTNNVKEYTNMQSRLRPGSFNVPNSSSIAPPPAVPSRRNSEIRLPDETPSTVAESDLISFVSPTSLKKPENTTFDKLLEDIQKLSAAPPPQPPTSGQPNFGSMPSFLNQQLNQTGGMQLVPFTQQQPAQKTPLTNEELSKLYSMPTQQVIHPHGIGFMRPTGQYTPVYQRPAITAAGYGYGIAPAHSYNYGFGMQRPANITTQQSFPPVQFPTNQLHQASSVEIPTQNVSNPSSAMVLQNPTNPMLQMTKSQSLSGVASFGSGPSMRSNSSNGITRKVKRNLGDDLIDLTQDDPSRVSVLEAFDPLLNEDDYVLWK